MALVEILDKDGHTLGVYPVNVGIGGDEAELVKLALEAFSEDEPKLAAGKIKGRVMAAEGDPVTHEGDLLTISQAGMDSRGQPSITATNQGSIVRVGPPSAFVHLRLRR